MTKVWNWIKWICGARLHVRISAELSKDSPEDEREKQDLARRLDDAEQRLHFLTVAADVAKRREQRRTESP